MYVKKTLSADGQVSCLIATSGHFTATPNLTAIFGQKASSDVRYTNGTIAPKLCCTRQSRITVTDFKDMDGTL